MTKGMATVSTVPRIMAIGLLMALVLSMLWLASISRPAQAAVGDPLADFVFLIDESGSMGGDIQDIINNLNTFDATLNAPGVLDAQYALVGFSGSNHSNQFGHYHLGANLGNAAALSAALGTLSISGGFEPGLRATTFAAQNTNFRQNSGRCFVLFTDEDSDGNDAVDLPAAIAAMNAIGGTWFGVTRGHAEYNSLAAATGGQTFDIFAFRANPVPVLNALAQACIGAVVEGLTLTPPVDFNMTGVNHTVVGTVKDNLNNPIPGRLVTILVSAGPCAGTNAAGISDANGEFAMTYTCLSEGVDIIDGHFIDDQQQRQPARQLVRKIWDSTPPICALSAINADPSPPANTNIDIDAQDPLSGIAQINVTVANNATVTVPAFAVGTTAVVTVHAEKIVQAQGAQVALQVIDRARNVTLCDPVITLEIRENGAPVSHTFTDLPQAESNVTVTNGDPGVKNLEIDVNGTTFSVAGLKDGEVRTLDISSAMVEGDNNTITLTAKGKPGGSVTVLISD